MRRRSRPSGRPSTTSRRTSSGTRGRPLAGLIDALPPRRLRPAFTHSSWAADRDRVVRAPRVPRRQRARARGRPHALRALPRVLRGAAGEDPLARRLACELRRGRRTSSISARRLADLQRGRGAERLARNRNVLAALLEARSPRSSSSTGSRRSRRPIVDAFADRIEYALTTHVDHKTELQEALARTGGRSIYTVLEAEGPAHERHFTCAAVDRRRAAGSRAGRVEEGGRAGGRLQGARPALASVTGVVRRRPIGSPSVHLTPSRFAGSSRSRTRSRCASSRASPSSSGRTAPASRTSPTRSSGRRDRSARTSCARRSPTTCSSRAPPGAARRLLRGRAHLRQRRRRAARLDFAEVSVARRLHRGGEGQYLVNKTAVRRLDLVELLADVGLGQGMRSIICQGKVEAILGVEAGRAARARRGGGRARPLQAPPPSRRAEARARRRSRSSARATSRPR